MHRLPPALVLALLAAAPLEGQVGLASSGRTVVLTATKPGSVRVGLPNGGVATLAGSLGLGTNDLAPVAIETAWDLDPTRTSGVSLVAYFQSPGAALTSEAAAIPSSAVSARVPTGSLPAYVPFTGAPLRVGDAGVGVAGGTLVLFTQPVTRGAAAGQRTDQLQVRIDLTGWPELPAGHYQGTLNLLAITQ